MTDEIPDRPNVIRRVLGECQCPTHQSGDALPSRIIEPLEMMRFPGFRCDRLVLSHRNHPFGDVVLIRIEYGLLPVQRRQVRP